MTYIRVCEIAQYEFECETHEGHGIAIDNIAEIHHGPVESFYKEYHSPEHRSGIWRTLSCDNDYLSHEICTSNGQYGISIFLNCLTTQYTNSNCICLIFGDALVARCRHKATLSSKNTNPLLSLC